MQKKIFKVLIALTAVFSIGFTYALKKAKSLVVNADEVNEEGVAIKISGYTVNCPAYIYSCNFNVQTMTAYIDPITYEFNNGKRVEIPFLYEIKDADDLEYFMDCMESHIFELEFDTWCEYGDDGLSSCFLIFSTSPIDFEAGQTLEGHTIDELKENYPCIIEVISPNNMHITAELVDLVKPEFKEYTAVFVTSIDNPATIDQIKNTIYAYDNVDGDITERIVVSEDHYSKVIKAVGGVYNVKFAVEDSAGNKQEITIHVKIEDVTAPVIEGVKEIESYTTSPISVDDIKESLTVTDNYDTDVEIKLFSDKYSPKQEKVGSYEVIFYAKDLSGNKAYHTVMVHVKDNDIPYIEGPTSYTKSETAYLTTAHIMANLKAYDETDGDITNLITVKQDSFSGNENTVGEYDVIFTVTDTSNNTSEEFLVTIKVTDLELPIFYVDDSLLNITDYEMMSHDEIVGYLVDSNKVTREIKGTQFICDEYSENYDKPGTYKVSVKLTYDDDSSEVMNLSLKVHDRQQGTSQRQNSEAKLSFFQRIIKFFKTLTQKIANFFANISVWFKKTF